jgi:hypothetical protein
MPRVRAHPMGSHLEAGVEATLDQLGQNTQAALLEVKVRRVPWMWFSARTAGRVSRAFAVTQTDYPPVTYVSLRA